MISDKPRKSMLRLPLWCMAALLSGVGLAGAARADMDYRCLTSCINGGGNRSQCMPQCTYDTPLPPAKSSIAPFSAPVPIEGNKLILPHAQSSPPKGAENGGSLTLYQPKSVNRAGAEDYTCLLKCQQNGSLYDFCEQQCDPQKQDKSLSQVVK